MGLFLGIAVLLVLLLSMGGTAAVAAIDEGPSDDPTCAPSEDPDEPDADASRDSEDGCEDEDEKEDKDNRRRKRNRFRDVRGDRPHVDGIAWLEATGVTKGCKLRRFCPNKPVTRAEFATLIGRLLGKVGDNDPVAAPADELSALKDRVAELELLVAELQEAQE
ncbi:hypothetical protein BH23ACT10_BH23ACT10_32200 [soil metagenome]